VEALVCSSIQKADGFLAVKAGPGVAYKRIDKLYSEDEVYLCGAKGDWVGIVYTKRGNGSSARWSRFCNVSTPWPRTMPYSGPCRSGWAQSLDRGDRRVKPATYKLPALPAIL
jgi:hypothetical protein